MLGSANTARCSGRTVAQPALATNAVTPSKCPRALTTTRASRCFILDMSSEIGSQTTDVSLHVLISVFGVKHHVRGFEPEQHAPAQGHQQPATGARLKPVA